MYEKIFIVQTWYWYVLTVHLHSELILYRYNDLSMDLNLTQPLQ